MNMLIQLKEHISGKWHSENSINAIFRNMFLLASGHGLARVIAFAATPIITRIYLPEHMGVLSVFIALASLLSPLDTLRYALALPLPKHDGAAVNLFVLCTLILGFVFLLIFFLFGLLAPTLFDMLSMGSLLPYWWLVPLAVGGAGVYELLSNWAIREKAFRPIARTSIWQSSLGATVKIVLGVLGLKPLGLLIGHVFSQAGGFLTLARSFYPKLKAGFPRVSWRRLALLGRHYADFPKYRFPSQLLLVLSQKLPLLFFSWKFGSTTTGHLGLSLMTIAIPFSLIGQTTGQAYYSEIACIGRKTPKRSRRITKGIIKRLVLISSLPCIVLFAAGPWLFQVFFGRDWHRAGDFTRILAVYLFAQFIYTPIANGVLNVFEKQSFVLLLNLSRVLLIFGAFFVAFHLGTGPETTLLLYSLTLSLQYAIGVWVVFRVMDMQRRKQLDS